jgi:hypothetical protein
MYASFSRIFSWCQFLGLVEASSRLVREDRAAFMMKLIIYKTENIFQFNFFYLEQICSFALSNK